MKKDLSFVALLTLSDAAYGYLDPGAGHLIWQYVLTALLGGIFFFGRGASWIKNNFKRLLLFFSKKQDL